MINLKERFNKGKHIGSGSFGEVFEAIEKDDPNKIRAAKIFVNSKITKEDICNELQLLYKLEHPSIIKFIGYSLKDFNNNSKPTLVMELARNKSLRDMINSIQTGEKYPHWTTTKIMINLYAIASGMSFIHSNNIIHRDLKPENILLDDFLYPKITDFGISKICEDASNNNAFRAKGTPQYMAPETFSDTYSQASDVYSYGIIMFEILTNKNPHQGFSIKNIIQNGYKPIFPDNFPEPYKDLILSCTLYESKKRPPFSNIIDILENDPKFLLQDVDEKEFHTYINFIKESTINFKSKNLIINFDDYMKTQNSIVPKVTLYTNILPTNEIRLYPFEKYLNLSKECKSYVKQAENNPNYQFVVGKSCIEQENGFPIDTEIGLKYIKNSAKLGCVSSALYCSKLYISGKKIPRDLEKAKKYLNLIPKNDQNGEYYLLYGKIMRKEGDYEKARLYLMKGIHKGNVKAMINYGKMILYGEGCQCDKVASLQYFEMARNNGYSKANDYIALIDYDKNNVNLSLKVLLLGSSTVGKSALLESLQFKPFNNTTISTVGYDYTSFFYGRADNSTVKFLITDTAGQERYAKSIPDIYYHNIDAIFLCYTLKIENLISNNRGEVQMISVTEWITRIKDHNPNCPIILVETKADELPYDQKKLRISHGLSLKSQYGCYGYILTSSKTKEGIKDILKCAADLAVPNVQNKSTVDLTQPQNIEKSNSDSKKENKNKKGDDADESNKKSGCC